MRTLLSQFCEEFEEVVRPLLDPLKQSSDTLSAATESVAARQILPVLRDLRHQLQVVADKVGEQQAYVLIFGPLKSGKSTLMNAMAAAYVSEVTSLPAYPCMVYVSYGEEREFLVTRYDGETETCADPNALRQTVDTAHEALAEQMRLVEARGEEFDAQVHYPAALRRIDVKLPATELVDSGAVLVDTPGLYTRMKFGYDRMTREFRDTAACAIFVVKSENLFLEQVFEEFNSLLSLFSRIFLVVNLDTAKKDLKPDGSLEPSLERSDPQRIIGAFRNLAMSAPLKAATEEGRLKIYPVDLQRAASLRLSTNGTGTEADEAEAFAGQADFGAFLTDLTDYLNSTEYLVAFLGDSIRRAKNVLGELKELCSHSAVRDLARRVSGLEADLGRARSQGDVLARLRAFDWTGAVREMREELATATRDQARQIRERTASVLAGSIEGWFTTDASLNSLVVEDLAPVFENFQVELSRTIHDLISERVNAGSGGLRIPQNLAEDLHLSNINVDSIGRSALIGIDARPRPDSSLDPIDPDEIPVRKSLWDWILFRSQAAVRRRLFGPSSRPTARLPASVKGRRIGEDGREAMRLAVLRGLDESFPEIVEKITERLFGEYSTQVMDTLRGELNTKSTENTERQEILGRELAQIAEIRTHIQEIDERVDGAMGSMDAIAARYGETAPEELTQPVELDEEPVAELEPAVAEEAAPEAEVAEEELIELEVPAAEPEVEPPVDEVEELEIEPAEAPAAEEVTSPAHANGEVRAD